MEYLSKDRPEIMSPAGDHVSLRTAIDAGCDAVYFGIAGMNMRAGAKNFSLEDLPAITALCHDKNVKAYLTLNTIVYESETPAIQDLISKAKAAGIDAIICWDFAVIEEARRQSIPVFISTQMSVSNSESILFFYKYLKIRRFVLARECSLEDIITIRNKLDKTLGSQASEIELEVFVHGAMCVSISGRCFISQFLFGKSANRGECIQPCRREYHISDVQDGNDLLIGNNYILSPKDLCTLPFIEKLIGTGITSFKIEGRNRSPEYVNTVTTVYRNAVDFYFENRNSETFQDNFETLKHDLMEKLKKVYNRGFSSGFYMGKPINEWTEKDGSMATLRKEYVGFVTNYYRKPGVAEIKIESSEFGCGDEIMFHGHTTGVYTQQVKSMEVEHKKVSHAKKGTHIGIKTDKSVRLNDKVYVLRERDA